MRHRSCRRTGSGRRRASSPTPFLQTTRRCRLSSKFRGTRHSCLADPIIAYAAMPLLNATVQWDGTTAMDVTQVNLILGCARCPMGYQTFLAPCGAALSARSTFAELASEWRRMASLCLTHGTTDRHPVACWLAQLQCCEWRVHTGGCGWYHAVSISQVIVLGAWMVYCEHGIHSRLDP